MNFCAIICEYNPFHNGHLHHIQKAKEISGCDGVFCVMGGNFNQRGLPCIFDKHVKAKNAIENGADIICELPTAYATQSAEIFSLAGLKIINSFKNITHICFGSECGDIELLTQIANFLLKPTKQFKKQLKSILKQGFSYATSIEKSLNNKKWEEIISKPNNLLAIEYLKALKRTKSKVIPVTIKREDNYNSNDSVIFKSATAIRNAVNDNNIQEIKNFVPMQVFNHLQTATPVKMELFNEICEYCIKIKNESIKEIFEVNEGIENYLKNANHPTSRYKINKINRTKLNIVLGIKKDIIKKLYKQKSLPYIKLLAGKKEYLKHLDCATNLVIRKNDINKKTAYFSDLEKIDNNSNILYNIIANTNLSETSLYEKPFIK